MSDRFPVKTGDTLVMQVSKIMAESALEIERAYRKENVTLGASLLKYRAKQIIKLVKDSE